jgi:hypothetical protein
MTDSTTQNRRCAATIHLPALLSLATAIIVGALAGVLRHVMG